MAGRRAQPEAALQRTLFEHIALRRRPGWLIWTTPNASKRTLRYGAELKRQGMSAGVGDISLLRAPNGKYHELELKTQADLLTRTRRGRPSPAQIERRAQVTATGATYEVAYGLDAALAVLTTWGAIR